LLKIRNWKNTHAENGSFVSLEKRERLLFASTKWPVGRNMQHPQGHGAMLLS
jgi:hypothetical protein